jgi:hypothetical protein
MHEWRIVLRVFVFTCGIEWVLVLKLAFILHFMASIPELILYYSGCNYCFFIMAANCELSLFDFREILGFTEVVIKTR